MLYKITLAAERDALPTILDLLTEAAQRGGISQSFVVECQPEAKDAPAAAPKRLAEPKVARQVRTAKPKRARHKGPPFAHDVIIAHLREHGASTKPDIERALTERGFAVSSLNTAMDRVRARVNLKNGGGKWWIEASAA